MKKDFEMASSFSKLTRITKHAPWWIIAGSLTLILLGVASVVHFAENKENARAYMVEVAIARTETKIDTKIDEKTIESEPIPLNDPTDTDPSDNAEPEISMPDAMISDHNESADNEDFESMKGDSKDASVHFDSGINVFDSIGLGSGSGVGRGRAGGGFGGRRRLVARKGKPGGATEKTQQAVLDGLKWLARHQNDDGSWGADTLGTHCTSNPPCTPLDSELGSTFNTGMTAQALLAFLGHGISIDSSLEIVDPATGKHRSAGDVVRKGIKWLLAAQKPDGSFSIVPGFEFPENDTLPTMAVCEAYGLSRNSTLKEPAQAALDFLVAAQKRNVNGQRSGWGPGSQADLTARHQKGELKDKEFELESKRVDPTVTCWVVMAVKSAQMCGLSVPEDVLPGALAYVVEATANGASTPIPTLDPEDKFIYHSARHQALAMLTRTFGGAPITDPYFEEGAEKLAADIPKVTKDGFTIDFYYWHFGTLALNQYDGPDSPRGGGGKYWERWNKALVEAILPLQDDTRKPNDCSRGAWLQKTRGNRTGMELRNTTLNIMTLEVYYRFENAFGSNKHAVR